MGFLLGSEVRRLLQHLPRRPLKQLTEGPQLLRDVSTIPIIRLSLLGALLLTAYAPRHSGELLRHPTFSKQLE